MERCPRCHGQLISCGCLDPENKDNLKPPVKMRVQPAVAKAAAHYAMVYYVGDRCVLCHNSGHVSTHPRSPHGGAVVPCICPNGQAARLAEGKA